MTANSVLQIKKDLFNKDSIMSWDMFQTLINEKQLMKKYNGINDIMTTHLLQQAAINKELKTTLPRQ